ncbi:hypothetical protein ES703_115277 [subsurface metagenome]
MTTESLLAEHIEPNIGSVRVTFIQMGADGELHTYSRASMQCITIYGVYHCDVMCPICKATIRFTAATNPRRVATRKVIDHIKAAHRIEALYCVNTPEGGYASIPKPRGPTIE